MTDTRASGILLPITALPGPYGVGSLGKGAYAFVDFLKKANQKYWQILPLGPTGYGDSPYQTDSVFAGNPYLIDLEALVADGLLAREEVDAPFWGNDAGRVDYGALYAGRRWLFIAPMQDWLDLGAEGRMNTPGILGEGNWCWRMSREAMNDGLAETIGRMTYIYGRS